MIVGNNNSFTGLGSVTFGAVNQGVGNYNLMAGFNNRIYGTATSETAMFGNSNSGTSLYDCLVSGTANVLTDARDSTALGRGLLLSASSSARIVIGQYNADNETNARLVVGNGTSTIARSNAFVVYQNGTAKVGGQLVVTASTFPTYLGNGSVANIAFSSGPNRSISVNASSSGAGGNLTIQAGGPATAGPGNQAGGSLILSSGSATGSAGSEIEFRTAVGGSPGNGIATPATRLKINALGGIEAGQGLVAAAAPQTVIGKYNNTVTDATGNHGQGVFIVGAGTAATPPNARKNAMRVTEDGTILIPQQGDLLMGAFNGGDQP